MVKKKLTYKELGVNLGSIKGIIASPDFDETKALKQHYNELLARRQQLDALIHNVEKTIFNKEGKIKMSDKEKFEGFKQKLLDDNEREYGKEIREKYGKDAVEKSYSKVKNMTQEEYDAVTKLSEEITKTLGEAFKTGDPAGDLAQKAADLHKQWLSFYWDSYSKEAHGGLAQMYVDDERFKAYYDKEQSGTAEFLRDAILIYTGMNK